jgi:hypothetical protein
MSFLTGWATLARETISRGWESVKTGVTGVLDFVTRRKPGGSVTTTTPQVTRPPTPPPPTPVELLTPVKTPVVQVQTPIPPTKTEYTLWEELGLEKDFKTLNPVLKSGAPIFGERYQYRVKLQVQPPYKPAPGLPIPPSREEWVTVTSETQLSNLEIVERAIAFAAQKEYEGTDIYGTTIVGIDSVQLYLYERSA